MFHDVDQGVAHAVNKECFECHFSEPCNHSPPPSRQNHSMAMNYAGFTFHKTIGAVRWNSTLHITYLCNMDWNSIY